jgi:hypothetical protein
MIALEVVVQGAGFSLQYTRNQLLPWRATGGFSVSIVFSHKF